MCDVARGPRTVGDDVDNPSLEENEASVKGRLGHRRSDVHEDPTANDCSTPGQTVGPGAQAA